MSLLTKNYRSSAPYFPIKKEAVPILSKYLSYAKEQDSWKVYWYMKSIIVIPCVLMVPSIIAMSMVTANFEYYVGLTMLLFFANVIVHIAGAKSTVYVPLYHFTVLAMILIPLIANLL